MPWDNTSGFVVTENKGVHITFKNGWSISIQWGPGNYCENRYLEDGSIFRTHNNPVPKSKTAEIAIIKPDGSFHQPKSWFDIANGWLTPEEVIKWMDYTANQPCKAKPDEH